MIVCSNARCPHRFNCKDNYHHHDSTKDVEFELKNWKTDDCFVPIWEK